MREGEFRKEILSEEEWNEKVGEVKESCYRLAEEIVMQFDRIDGTKKGEGIFKLMSRDMKEDISKRAGITVDQLEKYGVYHIIAGGTAEYDKHKEIDMPGGLILKAFEEKLEELKKQ